MDDHRILILKKASLSTSRSGEQDGHSRAEMASVSLANPSLADLVKAYPPLRDAHTVLFIPADSADGRSMLKAGIPDGARWITVHPNGAGSKGQAVLVQETKHGSGVFHVIGGAGGKLNYLKLRGVKSPAEYRQATAERQKARRAEAREQRARDRAAGVHEARQSAKADVIHQKSEQERQFIQTVAQAMGWKDEDIAFPDKVYENVSDAARLKAQRSHHQRLLQQAHAAVEAQRQQLLLDAGARDQAGLGEIPLDSTDPEILSAQDVDPVKINQGGLGYSTDYARRAEAAGLTADELAQERQDIRSQQAAAPASDQAVRIRDELASVRDPGVPNARIKLVDAKRAVDLLKAQKQLRQIQQQAREAIRQADSVEEPKAYVLEAHDVPDSAVLDDLSKDLRTIKTRAFLAEVGKSGGDYEKTLGRHIGVGAYNSINAVSLAATGAALLDRGVVDVLGVAGAAQSLARRLRQDLTPAELADLTEGLQRFHLDHYLKTSEDALREAREWRQVAQDIELDAAHNGGDLMRMQEMNAKRRDAVRAAQRILGTTLGEMEANAALLVALKQPASDRVEVSLGQVSVEDAIRQARAIGLERGDYQIDSAAGNRFLSVSGAGMDRLARPVNREDLQAIRDSLDIMQGRRDEDNWLPIGVAKRPDLAVSTPPGVAPRLAQPFDADAPDLQQTVSDYIGGRPADGDAPADILADLLSQGMMDRVGDRGDTYLAAVNALAPLRDAQDKLLRAEDHQARFEQLADAYVDRHYGVARTPLHRQQVPTDQTTVDALHRALSAEPAGVAAYKPVGDLTPQDQRGLRDFFAQHVAKDSPEAAQLRADLDAMERNEPERESVDMFGERSVNPEWSAWKQARDEKAVALHAAGLDWPKYVQTMGGPVKAYAAMQDLVRSRVSEQFHRAYNTLRPDAPVKLGRATISGNLDHLDAVDPEARDRRMEAQRQLLDSLRERIQGRYASGSVRNKADALREQQAALEQSQMGFFGGEAAKPTDKPLAADERHTLGHALERQIAGMMPIVGRNFKPGQPTKLWAASMNGKYINQQRAIKLLTRNKRLMLAQGTGSGKSIVGLAGFTHLHGQGKVRRGLFIVPSIVQGQFAGEALRYLEPGKYQWHIEPGASRESRIAAYKDPAKHFAVVTHQSFRDDMLHLGAQQAGISPSDMADRLSTMTDAQRKDWMRDLLTKEGIDLDYLMVDEGHDLLNRTGKENSGMANVIDALSANTPYYMNASADPAKNDPSEIFDIFHKMDPERYADRDAFMRRYGVDTVSSQDGLRREMARYFFPGRIDAGVRAQKMEVPVRLTDAQHAALTRIDGAVARARLARLGGRVDVDALKTLSPSSFERSEPARHEEIARVLQGSIGMLKESAIRRAINAHQDGGKVREVLRIAKERHGRPGIVFAHSRDAVRQIAEHLEKKGFRVASLTGADSAKEKEAKRQAFNPEAGEAKADILVASDAAAVGLNGQRGQWLVQVDTPQTAKTHAQRNGRIDRLGQKNDIELIDLVADHPQERKDRQRLRDKYALREVMTSPLDGLDDTGLAGYLQQVRAERAATQGVAA